MLYTIEYKDTTVRGCRILVKLSPVTDRLSLSGQEILRSNSLIIITITVILYEMNPAKGIRINVHQITFISQLLQKRLDKGRPPSLTSPWKL